jgi:phage tail sheath protein FI
MPEYLSPGVYVEEVDAGPKPIEGVSTSTAGAIGVTTRGPSDGKPELITSFAEFNRTFGGIMPEPDDGALVNKWALDAKEGGRWWQFALSVRGFFDNGGQRLYVKRVFSSTAVASSAVLGKGVASEVTADAPATSKDVRLRHLFGIQNGSQVNLFANGLPLPGNPFTVAAYSNANLRVTLNNQVGTELKAGRDFLEVTTLARSQEPVAAADQRLKVSAKAVGEWGDDLTVRIRPTVGAVLKLLPDATLGDTVAKTTVSADTGNPANPVTTIPVAPGTGANFANNDVVVVLGNQHAVTGSTANTIDLNPGVPAGRIWAAGTSIQRLRRANDAANPTDTLNVQGASALYEDALVEFDNLTVKKLLTVVSVTGSAVQFSGNVDIQLHETHKLRIIEALVEVQYAPNGILESSETFSNLRLADDKSVTYLLTAVNENSKLIRLDLINNTPLPIALADFPAVTRPTAGPHRLWMPLGGGNNDLQGLTVDDFVGVDGGANHRTGVQALEDIDEISICLAPGMWSTTVQGALIEHCETLKDRFAVLDPKDGLSIEGIREFREPLDTKYAALYYPWLEVRDPSVRRNVYIAPSGHMAGIYARVDVDRGVHKAPANETISGITKIAQDVTKREQDMLNPSGINALRFFPNRGNRVWGARTVSSDPSWKYINVRRLFIFVEESINHGTQWVVFEPNDEPLWARVRETIRNFLTTVWRNGALQGAKADEAFFVRCDRSTMTQDDIDNGRLIVQIGIAPVKPAEFVIFRIQQKTLDVSAS